ncbi:hypothetical protein [Sphingobium sp.]|uniref:hypothetical protein n=1 Tax=Sphingobium TaxID=165695 RepID=UPI001A1F7BE9|nr:hypothetical protein [Sphingobium sp.]MBJ7375575.1 hypothetical protein [Sphingobium sp.]
MPERPVPDVPTGNLSQVRTIISQLQKLHPWQSATLSVAELGIDSGLNSADIGLHAKRESLHRLTP